ncbi:hypothetical protein WA026_020082 [Henosepilachna vigintioctopunctata]|uniref:Small ribosomal subunit protein mS29 n=1 Tax=Henosepilachna vigintioctopunctata TaxID=420089 RepID=A0AAW1UAW0_9CUCU
MLKSVSSIHTGICSKLIRTLSTALNVHPPEKLDNFRCYESNPVNHTIHNVAQFYSLPPEDKALLFRHGGLPKTFETQCKTFNETCIMIRKPALDVINSLKNIDYSKPPCKFVLYGVKGSGRSLSLAHILHFGYKSGYLLVHVPWVGDWMRRCKESSTSVMEKDYIDLNIDAAMWLTHFKKQNEHLLVNKELKLCQEYVWNKRESTNKGAPLTELIDFGINRIKYASYCVVVLAEEIKQLSKAGVCKTLVAIDGYNAFFYPQTRIFKEKKEVVHPSKVTLTKAFLNLSYFNWNNAAIVLTVDEIAIGQDDYPSNLPRYLLDKEGFEHLDPFVPIPVENYSSKEFLSCMEYYKERKWIQYYPGMEEELAFISNSNPYKLLELSASL